MSPIKKALFAYGLKAQGCRLPELHCSLLSLVIRKPDITRFKMGMMLTFSGTRDKHVNNSPILPNTQIFLLWDNTSIDPVWGSEGNKTQLMGVEKLLWIASWEWWQQYHSLLCYLSVSIVCFVGLIIIKKKPKHFASNAESSKEFTQLLFTLVYI